MSERPIVELDPELMSAFGLNPLARQISLSRAAMFTGNLAQMVVIKEPSRKRIMSGMEREFGKTTVSIEFDDDVEIIAKIPRFQGMTGRNAIRRSPQTAVIYENYHTSEIGVLMINDYNVTHQHFGTEFKKDHDLIARLRPGVFIEKGTKVCTSPLIDDDGNYMYGRETNLLMNSDVAGTEDGVKVRRGWLAGCAPTGFETRIFEFGKSHYPIDQSLGQDGYKIFPEIGEKVSSNCLLVAMRKYDPISAVANMTNEALQQPDYTFDRQRFVHHLDAEVVDIKVERNTSIQIPPLPVGMDEQLFKYYDADTEWYRKIMDVYNDLFLKCRQRGVKLKMEPAFDQLVTDAMVRLGSEGARYEKTIMNMIENTSERISKTFRGVPMDAWRVEITFKYDSLPNVGYKITDICGDKSVVVEVVDDADMPVDENGVVADVVVDPNSRWNRMTPASPTEMGISAAGRDLGKRIQSWFGWDMNARLSWDEVASRVWDSSYNGVVNDAWNELLDFYKAVVPFQYDDMTDPEYQAHFPDFMRNHVANVLHDHHMGLDLFFPPNNPIHIPTALREIQKRWPPFITPVRFRGRDGKMKVSKESMLIAPSYYIVLEKTAEDGWMASSSSKRQVYGTTARLSNHDKYSSPGRINPVRSGESEHRLLAATVGGEAVADKADFSNNPTAHKHGLRTILTADKPTNIDRVIDRNVIPVGGHRPLSYLRHLFECSGKELTND